MVHSHSLSLGVNTELLDVAPPTSWADLWHPRFADMVCPGSIELTPGLLFLLQASFQNGGSYEDMEPGFQAIRELAPTSGSSIGVWGKSAHSSTVRTSSSRSART